MNCPTPRKQAYKSRKHALMVSHKAKHAKREGVQLYVYKCRCHYWHLTSNPPR
jgi:hypothetical protein